MSVPHSLVGSQMHAVAPEDTVWLSASAGTGKTQVLSSRVLRLLLRPGIEPSQILCLTFTKAGATEMAARINEKLARWVRLDDARLAAELHAIGADIGREALNHARTLFTAVLDSPGGGLRIDTIHAFSQWLLAAFPLESGLLPGTRPMEDRERVLLARQVLSDLLVAAEQDPLGDPQFLASVADSVSASGPGCGASVPAALCHRARRLVRPRWLAGANAAQRLAATRPAQRRGRGHARAHAAR